MRRRIVLLLGGLLILVLFAGCTAGPFGQSGQEPVGTLVVNNTANTTYTFEVWVVELPANVSTERNDGLTGTYPIGEGVGSTHPGEGYFYTSVGVPESAYLHGRYTLAPGEKNRSALMDRPPNSAVVVIPYQSEDHIIEWVVANCDDNDLAYLEVKSRNIEPTPDVLFSFICA